MKISLGDGSVVHALQKGAVEVRMKSALSEGRKCVLSDVLFVPDLAYNLFSVPKTTEGFATVTFDHGKCHILSRKNKVIPRGTKHGQLYYLDCDTTVKKESREQIHVTTTERLWHWRFGHLNLKYLRRLSRKQL